MSTFACSRYTVLMLPKTTICDTTTQSPWKQNRVPAYHRSANSQRTSSNGKYLMRVPPKLAATHCINAFRCGQPPNTPQPLRLKSVVHVTDVLVQQCILEKVVTMTRRFRQRGVCSTKFTMGFVPSGRLCAAGMSDCDAGYAFR